MNNRKLLIYAGALCALLVAAGIIGVSYLRKGLPYEFEIVPIDRGIAITNREAWNERDLVVSWGEAGGADLSSKVMKGSVNQCTIEDLEAGRTYSLRIRRTDLKGRLFYKGFEAEMTVLDPAPKYVVLIGASVGKTWDLASFPDRTGQDGYVFGYRGKYRYDKEDLIRQVVSAPLKPDMVIIKECAAYFPRDTSKIIEKLPQWVDLARESGVTPVLATCAPVTEANDSTNPGRQEAIDEANAFVRAYTAENDVGILDLAETLSVGEESRHLREDFAQPDGLHLAPKAYEALDGILVPALESARQERKPGA